MSDLARTVTHRGEHKIDVHAAVVGHSHDHVVPNIVTVGSLCHGTPQLILHPRVITPPMAVPEFLAHHLLSFQPSRTKSSGIGLDQHAIRSHDADKGHGIIDDLACVFFAFAQSLLSSFALRHITEINGQTFLAGIAMTLQPLVQRIGVVLLKVHTLSGFYGTMVALVELGGL